MPVDLLALPTTVISDALGRLAGIVGLQRFDRGGRMAGRALTVKTSPGDNLMIYHAASLAQDGDIIFVDGGGCNGTALVGDLLQLYAEKRGCIGFVIDGAIRDVDAFAASDRFCCYARSVSMRGPFKNGPGDVNTRVSIGGHIVHPGDYVVCDDDGVVTFSPENLGRVLDAGLQRLEAEEHFRREIETGGAEQSWIEKAFRDAGVAR